MKCKINKILYLLFVFISIKSFSQEKLIGLNLEGGYTHFGNFNSGLKKGAEKQVQLGFNYLESFQDNWELKIGFNHYLRRYIYGIKSYKCEHPATRIQKHLGINIPVEIGYSVGNQTKFISFVGGDIGYNYRRISKYIEDSKYDCYDNSSKVHKMLSLYLLSELMLRQSINNNILISLSYTHMFPVFALHDYQLDLIFRQSQLSFTIWYNL